MTRLAFGTGPLGMPSVADAVAVDAVHAALEHGIRHFDTAPAYGEAERKLGIGLRGVPRDRFTLSTKVGRLSMANARPYERGARPDGDARFDFTARGVRRSVRASLRRLGVDHVDIAFVHDPEQDLERALGDALETLLDLRREGVVGEVGVGTTDVEAALAALRSGSVAVVMLAARWTLADRSGHAVLDECARRGVRLVAAAPFNSGLLASAGGTYDYREPTAAARDRVAALAATCKRHGVELSSVALQFPLRHAAVEAVVTGMRARAEVEANVEALRRPVPEELWSELSARAG